MFTQEFSTPADVGIGSWYRKAPSTPGWYNASIYRHENKSGHPTRQDSFGGWYNASIYRHENILRFWDGSCWSTAFLAIPRLGQPNPVTTDTKLNRQIRWRYLDPDVIARAWREASENSGRGGLRYESNL